MVDDNGDGIDDRASWQLQPICPPDFFERLQKAQHQPEDYNHLLARTIQELCNNIATGPVTWVGGIPYLKDPLRDKFISLHRPCINAGWFGLNVKDRYLRVAGGVTTAGGSGFLLPKKAVITGAWAKSRSVGAWTLEVRKNDSPITLVSVSIAGGSGSSMAIDIDTTAGDFLQIYLSGSGVEHPIAHVEVAWRL